jgi:hypothetical protein
MQISIQRILGQFMTRNEPTLTNALTRFRKTYTDVGVVDVIEGDVLAVDVDGDVEFFDMRA